MILVDSSVWIDFFRGNPTPKTNLLDAIFGQEPLAIGDLILAEVLQGFRLDRDFHQAQRLLTSLTVVDLGGETVAIQVAQLMGHWAKLVQAEFFVMLTSRLALRIVG